MEWFIALWTNRIIDGYTGHLTIITIALNGHYRTIFAMQQNLSETKYKNPH
jgi:hypothetical protein